MHRRKVYVKGPPSSLIPVACGLLYPLLRINSRAVVQPGMHGGFGFGFHCISVLAYSPLCISIIISSSFISSIFSLASVPRVRQFGKDLVQRVVSDAFMLDFAIRNVFNDNSNQFNVFNVFNMWFFVLSHFLCASLHVIISAVSVHQVRGRLGTGSTSSTPPTSVGTVL